MMKTKNIISYNFFIYRYTQFYTVYIYIDIHIEQYNSVVHACVHACMHASIHPSIHTQVGYEMAVNHIWALGPRSLWACVVDRCDNVLHA